jgi:hypothetical protein
MSLFLAPEADIQSGWLPLLAECRIPLGVLGPGIEGFEPPLFEDMAEPRNDVCCATVLCAPPNLG